MEAKVMQQGGSVVFVQGDEKPTTSRLVWVLNRHHQTYREEFKGQMIEIPPNHEKKVKMPFLEARQFLGRGKMPAITLPNGQTVTQPKALYTEEIEDEYERDLERLQDEEKGLQTQCMICNKGFKNKKALRMHVMKAHPEAEEGKRA